MAVVVIVATTCLVVIMMAEFRRGSCLPRFSQDLFSLREKSRDFQKLCSKVEFVSLTVYTSSMGSNRYSVLGPQGVYSFLFYTPSNCV